MEYTGISKEKGEGFREEEVKKVDFVQTKDILVAAMEEAAKMQEENKQLREQLQNGKVTHFGGCGKRNSQPATFLDCPLACVCTYAYLIYIN